MWLEYDKFLQQYNLRKAKHKHYHTHGKDFVWHESLKTQRGILHLNIRNYESKITLRWTH